VVTDLTPSRASLAPTGFVSFNCFVNHAKPVGARLAREEALPNNKKPWFQTKIPAHKKKPLFRGALCAAFPANQHQAI
jgi:hypothetical protein